MNDIIPIVLGAAAATLLVAAATRPAPVREDFWGNPNRTVRRHKIMVQNNVAYGILPTPQTAAAEKAGCTSVAVANSPQMTNCRIENDFQAHAMDGYNRTSDANEAVAVYDRLIFANQKSRLAGLGDPIRGDLPIAPINDGWFRPSVAPNIDLRQGAIHVIAGNDNATGNSLRDLQLEHSAKAALMTRGDVVITAFP